MSKKLFTQKAPSFDMARSLASGKSSSKYQSTGRKNAQSSWAGRQAVWANIWCAVLAGIWPSRLRGFRVCGRPVPEVLLSRLPYQNRIIPYCLFFERIFSCPSVRPSVAPASRQRRIKRRFSGWRPVHGNVQGLPDRCLRGLRVPSFPAVGKV